jgi:hypothetical protein
METDLRILGSILLTTLISHHTDVTVIHSKYTLESDVQIEMIFHKFIIYFIILGVLFKTRLLVKIHLVTCLIVNACWFYFDSCILAERQRSLVPYSEEDLIIIHGRERKQWIDHFAIIIPCVIISSFKLLKEL